MVAIATVANGEGLISKICIDIKDHPTAAANDLENALAQANAVKTYPLSIQYVKDHSSELLAGGDLCKEFFTGLITQFKADLQNNGQSTVTDAEATKELLEIIKKTFGV
jgi:hypothetical protein